MNRRLLLRAALGFADPQDRRQGFDLQLTRYDERGWRATFYTTGMEHSPTSVTGNGWERTPWRVVQTAAGRVIYTPHQDARGGFYPFAGQAYWGGS